MLVASATVYQLTTAGRVDLADELTATMIDDPDPTEETPSDSQPAPTLPDLTPNQPESFAQKSMAQGSLFASDDADAPVATVMIVGGIMITSASAVERYPTLWLDGAGERTAFDVAIVGVDRFADIAVLASPAAADSIAGEPALILEELMALPRSVAGQQQDVVVGDETMSVSKNGAIIGVDEAVSHYSGHTIYSAIITSIPFEDHLAGAPLTTPAGDLVGFVVNAAGAVVAALPVDDFVRLAQSLLASGDSEGQDFALDVSPDDSGRPVVADVDPAGPFADDLLGGDVVVEVNGMSLLNPDHLTHLMRRVEPGESVVLTVERANRRFETAALQVDEPHLAVNPVPEP